MMNEIGFYRLQCCFVHVAVEAKMWPSNEVPNCQSVKNFVQVAAFAEITGLFCCILENAAFPYII